MSEDLVFPVPEAWAKKAHMDAAGYDAAWRECLRYCLRSNFTRPSR